MSKTATILVSVSNSWFLTKKLLLSKLFNKNKSTIEQQSACDRLNRKQKYTRDRGLILNFIFYQLVK
jgi:hypothetical protein